MATAPLTQTTGRRKEAVARAQLRPGTGQFTINGKSLEAYFPTDASQMVVAEPLVVTETRESYDVFATIQGGGIYNIELDVVPIQLEVGPHQVH